MSGGAEAFQQPYAGGGFAEEEWYESSAKIRVRDFPWIYSIVSVIAIFGVALLILQMAGETTGWAIGVSSTVFILLALWVFAHEFRYTFAYLRGDDVGVSGVIHMMDLVCAVILASAAISYTIYIIDNAQFLSVPAGSPYRKFVNFWSSNALLFATIGFGVSVPVGLFADLWAIVVPLNIIWLLMFVLSNAATDRLRMPHRMQLYENFDGDTPIAAQQRIGGGEIRGGVKIPERRKKKRKGKGNSDDRGRTPQQEGPGRPQRYPMRLVQVKGGKWMQEQDGAPSLLRKNKKNK